MAILTPVTKTREVLLGATEKIITARMSRLRDIHIAWALAREPIVTVQDYLPPRTCPFDPPEMLSDLREQNPIAPVRMWDGRQVWLVTGYRAARAVLRDQRFSVDVTNPGLPRLSPGRVNPRPLMSRMDDPRHGQIRRMLADEFLSRRIDRMRPKIERIVDDQIDELLATDPPVDLHQAYSLPVPSQLIGELLGVPPSEHRLFQEATSVLVSRTATKEEFTAADDEMYGLCVRLITAREAEPADDVLGRLVRDEVLTGRLSREEACLTTKLLILGGHETSANMISMCTLSMLLHPEWFGAMATEPDHIPGAVEELLRYHTPMHDGIPRVATEDVIIAETLIRAGDGVIVSLAAGNRDESEFDQPDELDMRRPRARRHLTFGHGNHKCLGQWLARAELQIALSRLAQRVPTMRLAVSLEELSFKEDTHVFGVHELPVSW
jgi:cytochrome P450